MARTTSKFNQRVSRLTSKLDDYKLPLGVLVLLVGGFLLLLGFQSTTGPPFQSRYEVKVLVPADAPPMRRGQEVRIAGRLAGLVSSVEPDNENGGAIVTANITKPEFRPIGKDASVFVRVHSIVYRTILEITPGNTDDPLGSGGTISDVESGVDLLEVVDLFDKKTRRSVRDTVVNLGFGVAGRGDALNASLHDLLPVSKNLNKQVAAILKEKGALGRVIAGAAKTTDALQGVRDDDVAGLIGSGGAVLGAVAERKDDLARTVQLLRPFEDEFLRTAPLADPVLDSLADTAVELEPAVRGLNAALPDIDRLLTLGPVLENETARIAAVTRPVLRTTRPLVRDIYPTVAALRPLLPKVKRIVNTLDPYSRDISLAGQGLASATSVPYNFGHGTGVGAPAGRVIPVLTCHNNRRPFPRPGQPLTDSTGC